MQLSTVKFAQSSLTWVTNFKQVSNWWQRGSVVRTSVFGWRTFPDLRLTCDHFVGKV